MTSETSKTYEPRYKDRKMNAISIIVGSLVLILFIIYMLDWHYVIRNSDGLDYNGNISGKVEKIRTSKGTTFIKIENEKTFWRIDHCINHAIEPSAFCDFIQKNDSIIKKPFDGKLIVIRSQIRFDFVVGNIDYNNNSKIEK